MNKPALILHQALMQAEPLRLRLPQSTSSPPSVAPQTAAAQIKPHPSAAPAAVESLDEDLLKQHYDRGFQAGTAQSEFAATKERGREVEQRARELADDLVQAALPQIKRDIEQQHREAREALAKQRELLDQLLQRIPDELSHYMEGAEDDILALAFDVVCRILSEQAATVEGLRPMLAQALKAWHGKAPVSIHLHPDDLSLLKTDVESLQMLASMGFSTERSSLRWVSDPKVQLGGCLIRSSEGALDSRLETQLEALKSSLLRTRESRTHTSSPATAEGVGA